MIIAGYFEDDASDELTNDPVFKSVLEKDARASQPTVSRFFNRMDEDTLNQFLAIGRVLRKKVYSIQLPQAVILDLDSTLLDAYGKQEGRAFNFHYQSNGYHPLVCYDGMTGDLIKIQLRDGTQYSCTGVVDFLQPILDEYLNDYPEIRILLRGDSGFATPDRYKQCEENGTSYVIRLKENSILLAKASCRVDELDEITRDNKVDYAVVYGEFMYTFVVTIMDSSYFSQGRSLGWNLSRGFSIVKTKFRTFPVWQTTWFCFRLKAFAQGKKQQNFFHFPCLLLSMAAVKKERGL